MERLTKRDTDGQVMMDCEKCKADWTGKHGQPMVDCTALYCRNRLKDRLAVYEDTGLGPESVEALKLSMMGKAISEITEFEGLPIDRLRELAEADKDGRLVVLEASDDTAADVAPVVRSRWRYCGFLQECQTCGEIYSMHGGNAGKSWNYCPNCGAKMEGEQP